MELDLSKVTILPRAMQLFRSNAERFNNNLNEFKYFCVKLIYEKELEAGYIQEVIIEKATNPDNEFLSSCILHFSGIKQKRLYTSIYKKEPDKINGSHVNVVSYTEIDNKDFELKDFDVNLLEQKDRFEISDMLTHMTEKTFGDTVGSRRVGKIVKGL
jgi:hypothetical protein